MIKKTPITCETIMELRPCGRYDEEVIRAIIGDGMELVDILKLAHVPEVDRIWLGIRMCEKKYIRRFVYQVVRLLGKGKLYDARRYPMTPEQNGGWADVLGRYLALGYYTTALKLALGIVSWVYPVTQRRGYQLWLLDQIIQGKQVEGWG